MLLKWAHKFYQEKKKKKKSLCRLTMNYRTLSHFHRKLERASYFKGQRVFRFKWNKIKF